MLRNCNDTAQIQNRQDSKVAIIAITVAVLYKKRNKFSTKIQHMHVVISNFHHVDSVEELFLISLVNEC